MPGGRIPKASSELQRRNAESQFVGVSDLGGGVPAPPRRHLARWTRDAREWWEAIKASQQAAAFSATDWQVALRVPVLMSEAERTESLTHRRFMLAEIRQLEDRLLVTVAARRRARIDLPGGSGGQPLSAPGTQPDTGGNVIDYRSRLGAS